MNLQVFGQEISKTAGSPPTAVNLCLVSTYLSRNFATLGPMIRQPPCDLMCWKVIHGWRLERRLSIVSQMLCFYVTGTHFSIIFLSL